MEKVVIVILGTWAALATLSSWLWNGKAKEWRLSAKSIKSSHDEMADRCLGTMQERDAAILQRNTSMRERDSVQADYDALIQKLAQQALTATPPQPQNRRIRAGSWSEVRKISEEFNRTQAETEEARERDTAFVE